MKNEDFVKLGEHEFVALSKDGIHWQFVYGQSWRNYDSDCRRADRIGNMIACPEEQDYFRYLHLANGSATGTLAEWKIDINNGTTRLGAKPERK